MKGNGFTSLSDLSALEVRSFLNLFSGLMTDRLTGRTARSNYVGHMEQACESTIIKVIDWGPKEKIPKEKFLGEWPLSSANDKSLADLPKWQRRQPK